ncbi:uncharacterized protein LY79DRAFT_517815 [Colletotrichum navitas]|uniref:Uncharacterized protein n=1 Tax=Colletotrichum navitas TaxID=681940 RepID=A0AAD8PWT7_9PEZI|nr:uncharacterized protein LY79DRAFT_517815 [Colletotrichum navitas]KAK1585972.1 hypothetical protein LY79DRAFT_517815 [Colletotrichum navitas]
MQFGSQTLLLALVGALSVVHASPAASPDALAAGEAARAEPNADCCSCDIQNPGPNYICTVPKGTCNVPAIACPHDPATQEQCCCCDINVPAMRCKAIPKGSGCICTQVKCPFQFDYSFLPKSG